MTEQGEVLPKELRLSAPPTMPQARSYLFKQRSTLSTYGEKQVVQINIPRLQRSYLTKDSYLTFRVNLTGVPGAQSDGQTTPATAANWPNLRVCLDTCGAYGIIDKIEVYDYLGSTLLESLSSHGAFASLMLDGGVSPDVMGGKLACYAGTKRAMVAADVDLAEYGYYDTWKSVGATNITGGSNTVIPPVSGANFLWNTGGSPDYAQSQSIYREFSIPLFSFLGMLSPRYVPMHNGFTIQITLASQAQALGVNKTVSTGTGALTAFSVSDVNFCCQVLELGPVAESMLLSSTQGNPLIVHTKAYRNYVNTLSANTQSYRLDLNLNVASLTALFWIMRPNTNVTGANVQNNKTLSQRIRNYLQTWTFQYGSSILPQTTGIQASSVTAWGDYTSAMGYSQCFIELMKAFRRNNDFNQATLFNDFNYRQDVPGTSDALLTPDVQRSGIGLNSTLNLTLPSGISDAGTFACGLDLQLSSENPYGMVSGLNTNGMNTSINAVFSPDKLANQVGCQVDAWAEYDSFINVSPGLATTVSF